MKAEQGKVEHRLKIVKGQVEGIQRMVEEDRYCIAISNQIMAAIQALKGINRDVLEAHLHHCVKESIESSDAEGAQEKIEEIIKVIDKLTK